MEFPSNEVGGLPRPGILHRQRDIPVRPIISQQGTSGLLETGTKCAVKNLYEGSVRHPGQQINWVEDYPDDLGVAAESAETAQYALLVRNRRNRDNSKKVLVIDSIVIQSPFLKSALAPVLRSYPGITTELQHLTFNAPFQPLIHRWKNLEKAVEEEQDPITKKHLDLFYQILHLEIKDTIEEIKDVLSHNAIQFNLLWAVFCPGDVIFALDNGREVCFELKTGQYAVLAQSRVFALNCEQIDWGGTTFGRSVTMQYIAAFEGTKQITQLQQFPFAFHPGKDAVRERLISRGKQFEALKGYHYKSYGGTAIGAQIRGGSRKFNVSSLHSCVTLCLAFISYLQDAT
jgi:hypothetical protein